MGDVARQVRSDWTKLMAGAFVFVIFAYLASFGVFLPC